MEYDKKFIDTCEAIFAKIIQNRPLKECLNTAVTITSDHLWFIYYMFFAIHNPKMEDYIQKKTNAIQEPEPESGIISDAATAASAAADIIKNMIKRRHYTSTIVFRLYTHAYTNNGNVTHIYPKYKNGADRLIKSFQSNHLKTTAVHIRRTSAAASSAVILEFLAYIITSAPTTPASSTAIAVLHKINNHIHYKRKDIIILALVCYMKIHEDDINTKNIFIAATPEELATTATATATATASTELEISSLPIPIPIPYDEKYKYLYI
jgi:hypothetical protein